MTPFRPPPRDHSSAALGFHALTKAMFVPTFPEAGLKGSFHRSRLTSAFSLRFRTVIVYRIARAKFAEMAVARCFHSPGLGRAGKRFPRAKSKCVWAAIVI